MDLNLSVVTERCACGASKTHFTHMCPGSGVPEPIYGCPQCDDHCPFCESEEMVDPNRTITVDEAIASLLEFKQLHGGDSTLMICMDGSQMAYLPVNELSVDDDEPGSAVALCCVAEGNHPLGNIVKLRPPNWQWKGKDA